jgi:hypothetical protein
VSYLTQPRAPSARRRRLQRPSRLDRCRSGAHAEDARHGATRRERPYRFCARVRAWGRGIVSRKIDGLSSRTDLTCPLGARHRRRTLPEARRFHLSLRSRCAAMLAGLRTLIQTRLEPTRLVHPPPRHLPPKNFYNPLHHEPPHHGTERNQDKHSHESPLSICQFSALEKILD